MNQQRHRLAAIQVDSPGRDQNEHIPSARLALNNLCLLVISVALTCTAASCSPSEVEQAAAPAATEQAAAVSPEALTVWLATVEGMTCAVNCAPVVTKALLSIEGVREVEVDFETKTARITADADVELTTAICDRSFDNQGYFLSALSRDDGDASQ